MTKDETLKLSDKELRIKAALLAEQGLGVDWGYGDAGIICSGVSLHAIDWENVDKNWWEYAGMIITNGTRYTYLVKHKKFGKVEIVVLNYLNDLVAAMELWDKVPLPKEIQWGHNKDGDSIIELVWDFQRDGEYARHIIGKPEELPRLITQAFVLMAQEEK